MPGVPTEAARHRRHRERDRRGRFNPAWLGLLVVAALAATLGGGWWAVRTGGPERGATDRISSIAGAAADRGTVGEAGSQPRMANVPAPTQAAATRSTAPATRRTSAASRAGTRNGTTATGSAVTTAEARVLALVNQRRAAARCPAVTADARLARAARNHSADMAARGYFDHNTPEGVNPGTRITAAGYRWSTWGENIAMGQPTPEAVMQAWMDSPGHRANILNCAFRNLGVGLAYSTGNRPYWTQDFGTLA